MTGKYITSRDNPKIKEILKLKQNVRERKKKNLTIIEGEREIGLAISAGINPVSFFYCPEFIKSSQPSLFITAVNSHQVPPGIFKKLSFRENPDGFLALAPIPHTTLDQIKISKNPLLIIVDAVEKPGNLGAIIRTADASGADAVLVCGTNETIFSPNSIRASQGTIFTVPIASGSQKQILKLLNKENINLIATTPAAEKIYTEIDFKEPSAILVGSEDRGLGSGWLEAAKARARIPMRGKIDSLNVSVSAAIVIYEALRQRKLG